VALRRIVRKVHGASPSNGRDTVLIAGLGNPGKRYAETRHNLGFMVADELVRRLPAGARRERFQADYVDIERAERRLVVAKPLTFMNNSGVAVAQVMRWYKIPYDQLLVIYDELDLAYGRLRLRSSGSAGGHNGIASVIRSLGTQEFARLRIGVGRPVTGSTIDYLLSGFTAAERDELPEFIALCADAAMAWLDDGIEPAMNEYNRRTVRRLLSVE
jgi:PTH1 family peptidyl-tRNA hydrolase